MADHQQPIQVVSLYHLTIISHGISNEYAASGSGLGNWSDAYVKAAVLVAKMSNEEKSNLTIGISAPNGCSGNSGGAASVGFGGLCLQDGPSGVRGTDLVSSFPSGIHIGATWNRALANKVATFMGAEFKRKGGKICQVPFADDLADCATLVHVALGPVVGPLGRVVRGGRNWEGEVLFHSRTRIVLTLFLRFCQRS
jgi:beta-glucosidase